MISFWIIVAWSANSTAWWDWMLVFNFLYALLLLLLLSFALLKKFSQGIANDGVICALRHDTPQLNATDNSKLTKII